MCTFYWGVTTLSIFCYLCFQIICAINSGSNVGAPPVAAWLRLWALTDPEMHLGACFIAGFEKHNALLGHKCSTWSQGSPGLALGCSGAARMWRQNFVCHKGVNFGKTLPLDFKAPAPADLPKRIFQVMVPWNKPGMVPCWRVSPGFWGQLWTARGHPQLGKTLLLPCWPAPHDVPSLPAQGKRSQGLSAWSKSLAGSRKQWAAHARPRTPAQSFLWFAHTGFSFLIISLLDRTPYMLPTGPISIATHCTLLITSNPLQN